MLNQNATLQTIKKRHPVGAMTGWVLDAVLLLAVSSTATFAEPIRVCPSNPHYFMYKGKPLLLITSDHHYGAIIDKAESLHRQDHPGIERLRQCDL